MAFQAGAFQGDAFQIPSLGVRPAGGYPSGDKKKKFDSEAYAYVYNNADRMRRRVENLPAEVVEIAQEVIAIERPVDRGIYLASKISAENKFLRLYLAVLNDYAAAMMAERLMRQQDDDLAIILLLSD